MIYTHAMQESVIHYIAAANSLGVTQSIISLSEVLSNVWRNYITKCLSYTNLQGH